MAAEVVGSRQLVLAPALSPHPPLPAARRAGQVVRLVALLSLLGWRFSLTGHRSGFSRASGVLSSPSLALSVVFDLPTTLSSLAEFSLLLT